MYHSILVSKQSGIVVLIDFTHVHGTDVRLPDGRSPAIVHWFAESHQVVKAQRVNVFPHKLVRLCRDNEKVFGTDYIDASWIDTPLGIVKIYFQHAVKDLLSYNFFLDFNGSAALSGGDLNLGDALNDKVLYSWGGHSKDIPRQVILFSSCIFVALELATKTVLTGATDNCVSEEFVFLMQNSSHLDPPGSFDKFLKLIPEEHAFSGLVKNSLLVLQEDLAEYLHAHFVFGSNLLGSRIQLYCTWCPSCNHIIHEFIPCTSCSYHSIPVDNSKLIRTDMSSCPETGIELESLVCSSNQFPPMAFHLLVDGYLVNLGFLHQLGASTAGIVGLLLMLLLFLLILQRFEAYVEVLLLQMAFIGFTYVGHELALILEDTREMYLITKGLFLHCGEKGANGARHSSGNVFNMPNRVPKLILHNHRMEQGIVMIPTGFGISFVTILKNQPSTSVDCKIPDSNLEDKVLIEGGSNVTNIAMREDSFSELTNYGWDPG